MSTPVMIEADGLCKQFGSFLAVRDVSFSIPKGQVVAFLGPNGAGKTTAMRILCTVLRPSGGIARVAGFDVATQPHEVRRHIGFMSANTAIYDRMSAWELVEFFGQLHGMPAEQLRERMERIFVDFQMNDFRDVLGAKMSTGMKQKVSIARALVNDPPVLIFDEPTAGLDVLVQRAVLDSIRQLRGRGKTILFSTHIMREVERLCDRVAIMARGKIVACGTLAELREMYKQDDLEELFYALVS